jgi:acetyl-CoA carboxylase biotin carboxyl carrier protein
MVDLAKIEKLMMLMTKHGFDSVQAESAGEKFCLTKQGLHAPQYHAPAKTLTLENVAPPSPSLETSTTTPIAATKEEKVLPAGETITSPFVGTFYRSPSPESPSFVEVGSKIKKGQALCIVEAMKLMNEIEAEIEGEIVAILVDNAKPVEFGTPLFIIAPNK